MPERVAIWGRAFLAWAYLSVPCVLSVLGATNLAVQWWPTPERVPEFGTAQTVRTQLVAGIVVPVVLSLTCFAFIAYRTTHRVSKRFAPRWLFLGTLLATWAAPVTRLIVPCEDPYDGGGSPLACFMGIVVGFVGSTLFFTIPLIVVLVVLHTPHAGTPDGEKAP
jgi:hypothetical protein